MIDGGVEGVVVVVVLLLRGLEEISGRPKSERFVGDDNGSQDRESEGGSVIYLLAFLHTK
jgi:hypothetical protein